MIYFVSTPQLLVTYYVLYNLKICTHLYPKKSLNLRAGQIEPNFVDSPPLPIVTPYTNLFDTKDNHNNIVVL